MSAFDWLRAFDIVTAVVGGGLAGLAGLVLWMMRARRDISDEISKAQMAPVERLSAVEARLEEVERKIESLPNAQDVTRLSGQVADLRVQVVKLEGHLERQDERDRSLAEGISRVEATLAMLVENELKGASNV
ncbi:MAG: DUF2730 family protein [Pseudomonadota bacterium]